MPGFSVGKAENKLGICASSTCPLNLDQVKVRSVSVDRCSAVMACHGFLRQLFRFVIDC